MEEINLNLANSDSGSQPIKINIDENPMVPQKFGVRGIPTIMLFKEGKLIDTKVGSLPKTALENWIKTNL